MKKFSEMNIAAPDTGLTGDKIKIGRILDKEIVVLKHEIRQSKFDVNNQSAEGSKKCLFLQLEYNNEKRVLFTGSTALIKTIEQIPKSDFPFTTKIIKDNERFIFT